MFDDIDDEDVVCFDYGGCMYVIYWIDGYVYVSDGLCMYE